MERGYSPPQPTSVWGSAVSSPSGVPTPAKKTNLVSITEHFCLQDIINHEKSILQSADVQYDININLPLNPPQKTTFPLFFLGAFDPRFIWCRRLCMHRLAKH